MRSTRRTHKRFRDAYQAKYKDYPRLGSVVGYTTVKTAAAAIRKAGSTDTEKLVAAMNGLAVDTPFGRITFRALDHQSTMGAYVGRTAVKDGKGVMIDWRYADGKDYLPSDDRSSAAAGGCTASRTSPLWARIETPLACGRSGEGAVRCRVSFASLLAQLLNGLAGASALFLVAAGLTLIFGVTRVVNFAHGSLYMLGAYIAYTLVDGARAAVRSASGAACCCAGVVVAMVGALIEALLLKRIYAAPELLQLAATFGVVLIVRDAALAIWGAEDLLGPRAPGFTGAVDLLGRAVPSYDLLLLALGPVVLLLLWLLLARTRFGMLVRAATENRVLAGALGIDERRLFTTVFALGALLAGLAGALQLPREPANLGMDLAIIAEAFVVTVVGGLGSIPGAFLAAAADRPRQGAVHRARHRRRRRRDRSRFRSSRWSPNSS